MDHNNLNNNMNNKHIASVKEVNLNKTLIYHKPSKKVVVTSLQNLLVTKVKKKPVLCY